MPLKKNIFRTKHQDEKLSVFEIFLYRLKIPTDNLHSFFTIKRIRPQKRVNSVLALPFTPNQVL